MNIKKLIIIVLCLFSFVFVIGCQNKSSSYKVIFEEGKLIEGKEDMNMFYLKTRNKEKSNITIISKYIVDGIQDENVIKISFDEKKYIFKNNDIIKEYLYLNYSIVDNYSNSSQIQKKESYCLANEEKITAEVIEYQWFSSAIIDYVDGIIIYQDYQYKDLCFYKDELIMIKKENRYYGGNSFNKRRACEIVDGLDWVKIEDINKDDELYNFNWSNADLIIDMKRAVFNDKNNLIIFKDESNFCFVTYNFDFENKVVMMAYSESYSMNGALFATLTDDDILATEYLFTLYQGKSETNYGEYECVNGSNTIYFEINQDNSGKIFIKDLEIEEELSHFSIHGDGYIYLYTLNRYYGENVYVFTMHGENKGYTYVASKSSPSLRLKDYFTDGMCFEWIGYPYPIPNL